MNKNDVLRTISAAHSVKGGSPQTYALIAIAEAIVYLAGVLKQISSNAQKGEDDGE